jgi:hypothetical protein
MAAKKGQTSVEFLVLLCIALLVLTATIAISVQNINSINAQRDRNDASNAVLDIGSAAKEVYAQGEGARKQVYIVLPESYDAANSFVGSQAIKLRAGGNDYAEVENFKVRGSWPRLAGAHWVWVISEGDQVRIGDAMLGFDKSRIYVVMHSNSTASDSFTATNIWGQKLNVTTATIWGGSEVGLEGVPSAFSLDPNDGHTITMQFTAGPGALGFYSGGIDLTARDAAGNSEIDTMPITVEVLPADQPLFPSWDIQGPLVTSIYQSPTPAVKFQPLAIFANASDVLTGNSSIKGCQIDVDSQFNWNDMVPLDGAFDQTIEAAMFNYTSGFALGPHVVSVKCSDVKGNVGPPSYYYFNVNESDMFGPIVIQMTHTLYPTTLSNLTFGGITTDAYTGGSNVAACNVKVGSSDSWHSASAVNGTWNTSVSENFTYNSPPLEVGSYTIFYQCEDSVGNWGGVYNDSFGVVDVDLMLVLDVSGSMAWNVTNITDGSTVTASSTGWSAVKTLNVPYTNGDPANLSVQLKSSVANCNSSYNATIDGVEVASGSTNSTSYAHLGSNISLSGFYAPFDLVLWLKRNASGCTASSNLVSLQQQPSKMSASASGANTFLDVAGSNIQAGLVSFTTTATTNKQLALMGEANQTALKASINALTPQSSTCIECGLDNACAELVSARSRSTANKVVVLLTDGVGNVGNSVNGAVYCRDRNVTVYTIGFGNDVDDAELTNIALLTHGDYYFAPNTETLTAIFQSIGKH